MSLTITKPDDSELTGLTLTVERAVPSSAIAVKIKNDGDSAVSGAFVTLYAEVTPGSGDYRSEGHPVVDEIMGRFQITGQDSVATPGQEIILNVVQPVGHLAVGLLPTILPGDWILADFWLSQAGSSAGGGAVNIKIEVAGEVAAYPLPFGVSQVGHGIDTGRKQARSFFIDGRETTATGTPDDYVHTAAGSWLLSGEEYADGSIEDTQFDQNDGALIALSTGESYIAVLTQGAADAPTVTKGLLAVAPTKPTPPSGELILGWVTVAYTAGTTTINPGDIEAAPVYGRYLVVAPPTGLSATVYPGEAVIADFREVLGEPTDVALAAGSTNEIWLEWNGALTVNTVASPPPSAGAVLLAEAVTDGSDVTALTDERTYINPIGDGVLEIREVDGAPDVTGVITLRVPNGSLTDLGSGVVELAFPAGGASSSTLPLTASDGVQRASGTDLSTDAALSLDVDGLTALAAIPDPDADEVPIWDDDAGTHKKLFVKYLGGQDYRVDIAGDGGTQPSTLSPLPLPGSVPMVFKDGLLAVPGAVDYTDDGVGGIVYTPVLALGQTGTILWRG